MWQPWRPGRTRCAGRWAGWRLLPRAVGGLRLGFLGPGDRHQPWAAAGPLGDRGVRPLHQAFSGFSGVAAASGAHDRSWPGAVGPAVTGYRAWGGCCASRRPGNKAAVGAGAAAAGEGSTADPALPCPVPAPGSRCPSRRDGPRWSTPWFYPPPRSPGRGRGPDGELPPYHRLGPRRAGRRTCLCCRCLNPGGKAYFTSRGIGVIDVDLRRPRPGTGPGLPGGGLRGGVGKSWT